MKKTKMNSKIVLTMFVITILILVFPLNVYAAKVIEKNGVTITKISNPDAGQREVDGLINGGDRENSYTWRLAERGDYIYIATTRNIASAIINMYGSLAIQAGMSRDMMWSIINTVTNGEIPRSDENKGANIISYNKITGEFKVIYTGEDFTGFRMAVTFKDNVYFGTYSAVGEQYILKLDKEGNFTKVFTTKGSMSLRANCVYDDHLYFAGADERESVASGDDNPTKMAVLQKSNEDDTVWTRVADYKDFGEYVYDPLMTNWAGSPFWELSSYKGYIYATSPSTAGFIIFKGHPATGSEKANEYGWYWEEVVGNHNGINEPGLSSKKGGEPGTMRSLIASTYVFNDELYVYNFDHGFGGEANGFLGLIAQILGSNVKASEYLADMYDSLQNPQSLWKLNDETGKFEECKGFTELVKGTTNEYVWRAGEYDGQMYLATFDAATPYNYFTRLTNDSFSKMTKEEKKEQAGYIIDLIKQLSDLDIEKYNLGKYEEILKDVKDKLKKVDFDSLKDSINEQLDTYDSLKDVIDDLISKIKEEDIKEIVDKCLDKESINSLIDQYITEENIEKIIDSISGDVNFDELISPYIDEKEKKEIINKIKEKIGYSGDEDISLEDASAVKEILVSYLKNVVESNIDTAKEELAIFLKAFLGELSSIDVNLEDLEDTIDDFIQKMKEVDIEEIVNVYLDKESINSLIDQYITEENIEKIIDSISGDVNFDELISPYIDEEEKKEIINKIKEKLGYSEDDEIPSKFISAVKEILVSYLKNAVESNLDTVKEKIIEIYNKIDWEGLEMYKYISDMVEKDNWGFDLIRTADGETFELITDDGFEDKYNYGAPSFLATDEGLYIGTCNPFYGGQLYLLTTGNEKKVEKYHEIIFELNSGTFSKTNDNPAKVLDGECVVKPENPTRSGYSFNDWYIDKELTTKFDFGAPIKEDIVLYAKWDRIVSGGGGSSSSNQKRLKLNHK